MAGTTKQLGHGHFDDQDAGHHNGLGSDEYQHGINSTPGQAYQPFGHFGPMISAAPIHGMSTCHSVVTHKACGSRIFHDSRTLNFECQGCGVLITAASELA